MKKKLVGMLLAAGMIFSMGNVAGAEETVEDLKAKIETLESEKAELEEKVETLESENAELKNQEPETEAQPETEVVGTVYTDSAVVKIVQESLNAAGFNCGTPDGMAGSKTAEAINAYEKEKGLNVNGVITDELLDALGVGEDIKKAAEREASKANYSADYTYDQLARNPDAYEGNQMKFHGKVLQADTSGSVNYLRLAINSNYDTVLFVTYDSSVLSYRLLEDDQITVYGESLGLYSYESVGRGTITIPWIQADIIEM